MRICKLRCATSEFPPSRPLQLCSRGPGGGRAQGGGRMRKHPGAERRAEPRRGCVRAGAQSPVGASRRWFVKCAVCSSAGAAGRSAPVGGKGEGRGRGREGGREGGKIGEIRWGREGRQVVKGFLSRGKKAIARKGHRKAITREYGPPAARPRDPETGPPGRTGRRGGRHAVSRGPRAHGLGPAPGAGARLGLARTLRVVLLRLRPLPCAGRPADS